MIWKNEFERIDFLIKRAVKELFIELSKTDEYIHFLAFCDYDPSLEKTQVTPYIIDNRRDGFKDEAWLSTLMTFLNSSYRFNHENTSDSKVSIIFEMMMYLHIWESRPYLRFLKRISNLLDKNEYLWKPKIKDSSKTTILSTEILPVFEKKNLKIAEIIKCGYIKQIRDAIAHNEYYHNLYRPVIILENYKPNPQRINKLHYNEWTQLFCYSFLLAYHLRTFYEDYRHSIDKDEGAQGIPATLYNKKGNRVDGKIFYNSERNTFSAKY